jgi:hypothetical protein
LAANQNRNLNTAAAQLAVATGKERKSMNYQKPAIQPFGNAQSLVADNQKMDPPYSDAPQAGWRPVPAYAADE